MKQIKSFLTLVLLSVFSFGCGHASLVRDDGSGGTVAYENDQTSRKQAKKIMTNFCGEKNWIETDARTDSQVIGYYTTPILGGYLATTPIYSNTVYQNFKCN